MTFNHSFSEVLPRVNAAPFGEPPRLVLRATCTACGATRDFGAAKVLPLSLILGKLRRDGWRVRDHDRRHDLCPACARGGH